ncbi:unnamed protein product, partial [marine sediment metagenome]
TFCHSASAGITGTDKQDGFNHFIKTPYIRISYFVYR